MTSGTLLEVSSGWHAWAKRVSWALMRVESQVFEAEQMLFNAEEMVEGVFAVGVASAPNEEVALMRGPRHVERVVLPFS